MILVLGGTTDAGRIIRFLTRQGHTVMATVVTRYGAHLAREAGAAEIWQGELTESSLKELLLVKRPRAVVDATHPFAVRITELSRQTCTALSIPYYRYRRDAVPLAESPRLKVVDSWEEAAGAAARARGRNVFLTVGTRRLDVFVFHPGLKGKRLVVRILPEVASLRKCLDLGLWPRDVVALQGPFSYELNRALYKQYAAEVLVTKNSGRAGGTEAKVQAALDLAMEVIVLNPPPEPGGMGLEEILAALSP
ncbi:precorrin-6A reductase [Moorellaceae bacterium AZ2]